MRKNIFDRLSQAVEEKRKEGHKVCHCIHSHSAKQKLAASACLCFVLMSSCSHLQDVDEFFQTERDHNLVLTGCTKTAAEVRQLPVYPVCSVLQYIKT